MDALDDCTCHRSTDPRCEVHGYIFSFAWRAFAAVMLVLIGIWWVWALSFASFVFQVWNTINFGGAYYVFRMSRERW